MPEKRRVSVEDYVTDHIREAEKQAEARLAYVEEHVLRLLEHAIEKVKDEAWETRAWILLLTAASWGALAQDQDPKRLIAAAVTLFLVVVAGSFMVLRRIARRKRQPEPPHSQQKEQDEENST